MTTISLSYDLSKDADAQAFRVALVSEDLFTALKTWLAQASERRDKVLKAPAPTEMRKTFRASLVQQSAEWVFLPGALDPKTFKRPARPVTLTFESGAAYVAFLNGPALLSAVREVDDYLGHLQAAPAWKDVYLAVAQALVRNDVDDFFQVEPDKREAPTVVRPASKRPSL